MHISLYTKIIHQIFFENGELFLSSLRNLSDEEKIRFIKYVSNSRLEDFVLKKIGFSNLESIFGKNKANLIRNNSINRAIRTAENKRFAYKISQELQKKSVNHVLLKGVSIHEHFYEDYKIRPISDVDILIDQNNLEELLKICERLNFDVSVWRGLNYKDLVVFKNPNLKHANGFVYVDIHHELKASLFSKSNFYKKFGNHLLKNAKEINSPICSIEDCFIHCLFHGTIHSNYNVGPVFIMDMTHMVTDNKINWILVKEKIKKYNLIKEFNEIIFFLSTSNLKIDKSIEVNISNELNFEELKEIFMFVPENKPIFAINSFYDIRILIKKIFLKEYLFEHNQQKNYFKYLWKNMSKLFTNHFLKMFSDSNGNSISRKRYKLLRRD